MCSERSERPDPPHECELKHTSEVLAEMLKVDGRMRDLLPVHMFQILGEVSSVRDDSGPSRR